MPVYRYDCDCGYHGDLFLKADKSAILISCLRCGKKILSRQVRDKQAKFSSNNDVTGIFRDEV